MTAEKPCTGAPFSKDQRNSPGLSMVMRSLRSNTVMAVVPDSNRIPSPATAGYLLSIQLFKTVFSCQVCIFLYSTTFLSVGQQKRQRCRDVFSAEPQRIPDSEEEEARDKTSGTETGRPTKPSKKRRSHILSRVRDRPADPPRRIFRPPRLMTPQASNLKKQA